MVAVSLKKNFFKQKTAYEIYDRLVGSEMCIRDRNNGADNISLSDFESFEDTMTAPSGLSFSINSAGELEMTV